jgi:hypothetical protein
MMKYLLAFLACWSFAGAFVFETLSAFLIGGALGVLLLGVAIALMISEGR